MIVSVEPTKLCGRVTAPPSKSFAHRYLIAAFLSGEETIVENVGASEDVSATIRALTALGGEFETDGRNAIFKKRNDLDGRNAVVDCSESGSTLRFLLPVAAALGIRAEFVGSDGLMKRPLEGLIRPLNDNGADIVGTKINGKLKNGKYIVDGSVSSQYITGLLFALTLLDGDSEIIVQNGLSSGDYVEMTLGAMKEFGIEVRKTDKGFAIRGERFHSPKKVVIEGDYSGAAFMLAAGAIGGDVLVNGLKNDSLQGDGKIVGILRDYGAEVTVGENFVRVAAKDRRPLTVDIDDIPDLAQIIAVMAAFSSGRSTLKNVGRLKIKESDRVKAIEDMLSVAKVRTERSGNDLIVYGENRPIGGLFSGGNDHRTVMSSTILASFSSGASTVFGAEAVKKSYVGFFDDIKSIGGKIDVHL